MFPASCELPVKYASDTWKVQNGYSPRIGRTSAAPVRPVCKESSIKSLLATATIGKPVAPIKVFRVSKASD